MCVLIAEAAAAASIDMGWDFLSDIEELRSAFKSGGVEECRSLLERKRDEWKNVPLNVAVIGNSGVGKSSFINAIRCVRACVWPNSSSTGARLRAYITLTAAIKA